MNKKLFIVLLFLSAAFVLMAFLRRKQNRYDLEFSRQQAEKIDSLFQDYYLRGEFNGTVLVVREDSTIFESSFGYSDGTKTQRLDRKFRFNMGSIYKEFPAIAIMQLAERGHLKLQDRLQQFMPELPVWSQEITVKQLLQYTSGLPRVNWVKHDSINDQDVLTDLIELKELLSIPGEEYLYTNNSPFLLLKIVERITSTSFKDYAQEHLFAPLGMENTLIKPRYPFMDRNRMAIPFNADGQEDTFPIHLSSILICSTPRDMHKWLEGLHSHEIISETSLLELSQNCGLPGDNIQSPLGFAVIKNGDITQHTHHGSSGNYEALISRFNNIDLTVLIMTNQKHGNLQQLTHSVKTIVVD